jgi:alpha-D-ribose 1-methylphosphonate 5-triphosphate synthase subunit PhnG
MNKPDMAAPWHALMPRTGSATVWTPLIGAVLVLSLAACATTEPPASQLAVSRAAVAHASTADTSTYAPVDLQSAKDKLAAAEKAMKDKDYQRASELAAQAQVDAQLAESKAESARAAQAPPD